MVFKQMRFHMRILVARSLPLSLNGITQSDSVLIKAKWWLPLMNANRINYSSEAANAITPQEMSDNYDGGKC